MNSGGNEALCVTYKVGRETDVPILPILPNNFYVLNEITSINNINGSINNEGIWFIYYLQLA